MKHADLCGICDKPFPKNLPRFLHFIGHIREGKAIGILDPVRGNWKFTKVQELDLATEVTEVTEEEQKLSERI